MSDTTKIEWTDRTWNPVSGCEKVSPGCDHCYADTMASRFAGGKAYPEGFDVTLHPAQLPRPLSWRKAGRTFVCSMGDLFHADVPDAYIAAVWCSMWWTSPAVRSRKPVQTFQVLTKRHARMRSWVHGWGDRDQRVAWIVEARARGWCDAEDQRDAAFMEPVLRNVWLGVSVEDQKRADLRIPALLQTPAAVRFLSCEPLLGPVDLGNLSAANGARIDALQGDVKTSGGEVYAAAPARVDWVIAGGESGQGVRPMHPAWVRSLRDQCHRFDMPFFFKQWGAWGPVDTYGEWTAGGQWIDADGQRVVTTGHPTLDEGRALGLQFMQSSRRGKAANGRTLDGRTWDEFPR